MNIKTLKEIISDLPDDLKVKTYYCGNYDRFTTKNMAITDEYLVVSKSTDREEEALYLEVEE